MFQSSHIKAKVPATPFYYGWVIVFISAWGIFFSGPGQTYSNAVFIDFYIRDFGWCRSFVSGIYSVSTLSAGLLLLLVGRDDLGALHAGAAVVCSATRQGT